MSGIDREIVEALADRCDGHAQRLIEGRAAAINGYGYSTTPEQAKSEEDTFEDAATNLRVLLTALAAAEAREAKLREALEGVVIYGSDTLSGPVPPQRHDLIWARDGIREMVRRARAALTDKGDTDHDR